MRPSGSATSCARFVIAADSVSALDFGDDTIALRPRRRRRPRGAAVAAASCAGPEDPEQIPRHRQRAFPLRSAAGRSADPRRDQRHVEWLFAFPQRLSVTISDADRLVDMPREELAQAIWQDVCKAAGIGANCRIAALADRARAARDLRGDAGAECAAAGRGDGVAKICFWPATGLRRGCPQPSRERSARATAPPIWFWPGARPDQETRHGGQTWTGHRTRDVDYHAFPQRHRYSRPGRAGDEHLVRRPKRSARQQQPDGHWVFELEADAPSRPNTCCCAIISANPSTRSWSARSPTICAASRARMAAGRCSTTARST